jgi:two-component system, NarL family, invasion response regulator UvrY
MHTTINNIFLVDDHLLLRDALAAYINNFEGCTVVGVAADGQDMIRALENNTKADIVILDLNMPNMDGYEAATWLKENRPQVKILILTMYDSEVALIRLLQTGVRGFMKKDILPNDLKTAIQSVAENGYYYCNSATGKLASFFYKQLDGQSYIEKTMLIEPEIEFLRLVSTDLPYKEIAKQLNMTARAIDALRDKMFMKLDVKSRVGLAIYALKSGIVSF